MEPLERARVTPARPGLRVLDPDHGGLPLPPEGSEVVLSSYWLRRIADGDVRVEGDAPPRLERASSRSKERERNP